MWAILTAFKAVLWFNNSLKLIEFYFVFELFVSWLWKQFEVFIIFLEKYNKSNGQCKFEGAGNDSGCSARAEVFVIKLNPPILDGLLNVEAWFFLFIDNVSDIACIQHSWPIILFDLHARQYWNNQIKRPKLE